MNYEFLEQLIGYHTRRASIKISSVFFEYMSIYSLSPVEFTILSIIKRNPGINAKLLCNKLGIRPPNMATFMKDFEERKLISKTPSCLDKRTVGISLTKIGTKLIDKAEISAIKSDKSASENLEPHEKEILICLLKKIYAK